jgi:hypothetical protein
VFDDEQNFSFPFNNHLVKTFYIGPQMSNPTLYSCLKMKTIMPQTEKIERLIGPRAQGWTFARFGEHRVADKWPKTNFW